MLISQQNIIPKYYTNSIPKYFTIFLNIILLILETLQKSDHSGVQTKRRRGKKTKRIDIVMSEQFHTLEMFININMININMIKINMININMININMMNINMININMTNINVMNRNMMNINMMNINMINTNMINIKMRIFGTYLDQKKSWRVGSIPI